MDEQKPDMVKVWANRLAGDKLAMDRVSDADRGKLFELVVELAKRFPEKGYRGHMMHVHRLHFRKDVCNTAIDMGIDLLTIKALSRYKRGKPLIGRGLLDVWTAVCTARFGSVVGTNAWFETKRRDIKTKLSKGN